MKRILSFTFTVYCLLFTVHCSFFRAAAVSKDPKQPVDTLVEDLLSRMTLEEKTGQINMPCVYMLGQDIPSKNAQYNNTLKALLKVPDPAHSK